MAVSFRECKNPWKFDQVLLGELEVTEKPRNCANDLDFSLDVSERNIEDLLKKKKRFLFPT